MVHALPDALSSAAAAKSRRMFRRRHLPLIPTGRKGKKRAGYRRNRAVLGARLKGHPRLRPHRQKESDSIMFPPRRIVCLTEETVETLYLLGRQDLIVGISGYTVRPPEARRDKPRVSAFISADIGKIETLRPDLVLTFSDLQADIVAALVRRGVAVHAFNQRDIAGILDMIQTLGALVDARDAATRLVAQLTGNLDQVRARAASRAARPRIFFEEWDDPLISGIGWVSELIEIAGGIDVFAGQSRAGEAKGRIVAVEEVIAAAPDIIVGSWCGKKFRPEKVNARPGFAAVPAVRDGALHEIKSSIILQPGPAALSDGLAVLETIIADWATIQGR
jgi:iron complex transport system substrate-binding protein